MDLKVVRYIREASEKQLVDLALVFIQRYPAETLELIAEVPEAGLDITPKDVPSLPKSIFISDDMMHQLTELYGHGDKVAVIKQVRTIFNYGLKEAHDIVNFLIDHAHLKNTPGTCGIAPPVPVTPRW